MGSNEVRFVDLSSAAVAVEPWQLWQRQQKSHLLRLRRVGARLKQLRRVAVEALDVRGLFSLDNSAPLLLVELRPQAKSPRTSSPAPPKSRSTLGLHRRVPNLGSGRQIKCRKREAQPRRLAGAHRHVRRQRRRRGSDSHARVLSRPTVTTCRFRKPLGPICRVAPGVRALRGMLSLPSCRWR